MGRSPYQSEKRRKELARLEKQKEKRERRFNKKHALPGADGQPGAADGTEGQPAVADGQAAVVESGAVLQEGAIAGSQPEGQQPTSQAGSEASDVDKGGTP